MGSPESVNRYATRQDGAPYGAHLAKVFEERRQAALQSMDESLRQQVVQATLSGYWLAELHVPEPA